MSEPKLDIASEKNLFQLLGTDKPVRSRTRTPGWDEEVPGERAPGVRCESAWAESEGRFWGSPSSHERLPVGIYRMENHPQVGPTFIRQKNDTDTLVALPDCESARIVEEIRAFKSLRPAFRAHGFLFKRGFLLWGPPGSGKTCTLQLIMQLLMQEHDSIAVLVEHPGLACTCLQGLRRIEPERQIVALFEDLDALCERYEESAYLALLDGEAQVDNIVYVATTNYPERLDRRFVDRPSRFDTVRYIGMPSPAGRLTYLRAKLPAASAALLNEYVALSEGFSIAHLRELIILTHCFGAPLEEAVARLNHMRFSSPHSEKPPGSPGFGFVGRRDGEEEPLIAAAVQHDAPQLNGVGSA
jgi:hypothetical protein